MELFAYLTLTKTEPTKTNPEPDSTLKGESTDGRFLNGINVLSYSYSLRKNRGATEQQVPTVPGSFYVIKAVDSASPLLFECAGKNKAGQEQKFKYAVLSVCRQGLDDAGVNRTEVYWRMTFEDAWVTSIKQVGDPLLHRIRGVAEAGLATTGPVEHVSFMAKKVKFVYEPDVAARKVTAELAEHLRAAVVQRRPPGFDDDLDDDPDDDW